MPTSLTHAEYWLAALLFLWGVYGVLASNHLLRKLMAMNIMQVGVIVFFIALAAKSGATAPVVVDVESIQASGYVNPLPHALMLTAIVVSVSTTGVALALLIRIQRRYGTLQETTLLERLKR